MKGIKFRCQKLPHRLNTNASDKFRVKNIITVDSVAEIGRPTGNRRAKKDRPIASARKTIVTTTRRRKVAVVREKDTIS